MRAARGLVAGALLVLLLPAGAHAQALTTVRLAGGETALAGRTLTVTGGYVDPRTGRGRVEHGRRVVRLGGNVRRVRTSGFVTRVVARSRRLGTVRLRLRLAEQLLTGGTTTLTVDPSLGLEVAGGTFAIAGGRIDARTPTGEIAARGVMFVGPVDLRDPAVRPGEAVEALVGDFRPDILTLAPSPVRVSGLRMTMGPAAARLTAIAADRLNTRFDTDRFHEGLAFGAVTVRGRLRG